MNEDSHKTPHGKTPTGQYYLLEEIAQGGMAKIYKGLSYDEHGLKKTVVIKKILPHIAASKEFIDDLIAEAKIAVSLSHGNIAQIYDLGKSGEDYFIVMEYVQGKTLSQIHRKCTSKASLIPIQFLCYFMCEALNGLDYMHRRTDEKGKSSHIVHRDISPQNLMISYSGHVKIIDFGIAKSKHQLGSTDSGILKGKFAYMSPEQAKGERIDHRSDIFSLGVIFHEFLTGKRLFKAEDNRQTIRNVRRAKIDPPSTVRDNVPEELDKIIIRALSKNRRHRYAFASDMRDDLLKFLANNYNDVKPSDVENFVTDLFKDEIEEQKEFEESKTPVQIIENTSSALADESQFEETGQIQIETEIQEDQDDKETDSYKTSFNFKKTFKNKKKLLAGISILFLFASLGILIKHFKKPFSSVSTSTEKAQVLITIEPAYAQVYIDGKLFGDTSPVSIKDITPNKQFELSVKKDEYISQTKIIELKPGQFKNLNITLTPAIDPKCTLIISSTPTNATVFLDDKETNYRTPAIIKDVETGKYHSIGLFLQGYKFWSKEFKANPSETHNFEVELIKDYAILSIQTIPKGALILLNGTPFGESPLVLDTIEPKKIYNLEVWKKGFQTYVDEIKMEAGKTKTLHIKLEKESATQKELETKIELKPMQEANP